MSLGMEDKEESLIFFGMPGYNPEFNPS